MSHCGTVAYSACPWVFRRNCQQWFSDLFLKKLCYDTQATVSFFQCFTAGDFLAHQKMRFAYFSVIFLPPFFQHRPWSVCNWEFHLLSVIAFFFFPDVWDACTNSLILVCHEFRIRLDMLLSTHVGGEWCIFTCRPKTIDVILCVPQLHKHSFHWRRFIPTCSIQF